MFILYPTKLLPAFKDYIWGGTRLCTEFNKHCNLDIIAESWELACHKDGDSVIADGEYKGNTLSHVIDIEGKSILGTNAQKFDYFPILIKLIDAKDNLSIQVHPDNEYAEKVEGEYGKTEMWYIVDCDENAELIYGFKNEITKEEFEKHINDNTLTDVVNKVPVKKGDVFFIKSGTLHAIGKGILIAEIQQNSNTTYRVYDFGRVGKDGKPRELHIKKALDVTSLKPVALIKPAPVQQGNGYNKRLLSSCEYFTTYEYKIDTEVTLTAFDNSFHSLLIINGNGNIIFNNKKIAVNKGDSIFIPSNTGNYKISGSLEFLLTQI